MPSPGPPGAPANLARADFVSESGAAGRFTLSGGCTPGVPAGGIEEQDNETRRVFAASGATAA